MFKKYCKQTIYRCTILNMAEVLSPLAKKFRNCFNILCPNKKWCYMIGPMIILVYRLQCELLVPKDILLPYRSYHCSNTIHH